MVGRDGCCSRLGSKMAGGGECDSFWMLVRVGRDQVWFGSFEIS